MSYMWKGVKEIKVKIGYQYDKTQSCPKPTKWSRDCCLVVFIDKRLFGLYF